MRQRPFAEDLVANAVGLARPPLILRRASAEALVADAWFGATMFTVYVLRSKSKQSIYIGHTNDLGKRLRQHNSGYSRATAQCTNWIVVCKEEFPTRSLAMRRERYLKSGDGRNVLISKGIIGK